jgi:hypothetical protein
VRLFTTLLWSLASVIWLPWFLVFARLLVDLALGTPLTESEYLNPALVGMWPVLGWTQWGVISWLPIFALLAMGLVYIGWRFFWWADDWLPSYRTGTVVLTILIPPATLPLLLRDARHRFRQRNRGLQAGVDDALERVDEQSLRLLS